MQVPQHRRAMIPQWKPLRLFNFYRITIGLLLLLFGMLKQPQFDQYPQPLLSWVTGIYLLFALTWMLPNYYRHPTYRIQVYIQTLADILFIVLIMHLAGGITSGLGMLMIAAIAGASLLIPGHTAMLFAAVAALTLLAEQIYSDLYQSLGDTAYGQTTLLGASLFMTAILAMYLARRAELSEELAERRGIDLENLAKLNEYIVNRMSAGIIVVDEEDRIRLINQPACALLGRRGVRNGMSLQEVSEPVFRLYSQWIHNPPAKRSGQMVDENSITGLQIRITHIGSRKEDRGTVIYLQNTADINRQIQATKLASLGRLTASIAHEIRNPLGAISHAVQLLDESPGLDEADERMVRIIHDQSRRMNEIIHNILQLSRKELPKGEVLHLRRWLSAFVGEYARVNGLDENSVTISVNPADTQVYIDQNHLHQIMWNLFMNVKKHGIREGARLRIDLRGGISRDSSAPYLDVVDHGPGIEPSVQTQLFEPFFTTSNSGTGLGLFIARELLKNNGGDLSYIENPNGGSCFRISFPIHQGGESALATRTHRR